MARAHNLLTQDGDGGSALETLLRTELAPYEDVDGRVAIAGPPVTLTPRAGLALALAVHELATNAAKYGALSHRDGRLSVSWREVDTAGQAILRIDWREEGGPPVERPAKRGFGTTLIERALAYEFDARVERSFARSGVNCVFDLPLRPEVAYVGAPQVGVEGG